MVRVDVRVAARAIHLVVDGFSRATLAATSRDVVGANSSLAGTERARLLGSCVDFHGSEATGIETHICVSTSAISIVDFGTAYAC